MSGQRQDGIPIAEASAALGLSAEALRKRLNRGTLDGYKQDGAWFVVLTPQAERQDAMAGRQDVAAGQSAGRQDATPPDRQDAQPIEARYTTTPADVERAIEATAARYVADFAGLYDRISAEVGARYEQTIAAKDETIATQADALAELRRRAEVAAAALAVASAPRAAPQPPSAAPPTPAPVATPAPEQPAQGLWQRLRRLVGGE